MSEAVPPRVYDEAAQLERTAMAWNRSLLTLATNGALLVRVGHSVGPWCSVVGVLVLVITLPAWWASSRTYRRRSGRPAHAFLAHGWHARIVVGVVLIVSVADLAAILSYG
ncbi:MAG TPA: DUF202 domain-containing protein [Actinopolymorphaceae bacterium]